MINMKIEVTKEQPLSEIVNELERLGCISTWFNGESHVKFIGVKKGNYSDFCNEDFCNFYSGVDKFTTLAELKLMK